MKAFSLVTTATLATLMVGGTVTNAATYPSDTQATMDGTSKFTKDVTPPKGIPDPENPGESVEPPGGNENNGELMITYVSDLNFGTHKEGESYEWFAKADEMKNDKYVTPFVSIKDAQGANRNGWILTVTLDELFTSTDGNELKDAKLLYSNMSSKAPEGAESPATPPTVTPGEVELTKGTARQIAISDKTNGYGQHSIALGELDKSAENGVTNGVKLTTINHTQPLDENYKTTITYELIAEPQTSTLEVRDSEIFVGDKWTAEDNFVTATGKDGKDVAFGDIVVEGTVDTSKAGEYKVVYKNDDVEQTATIKVKENQATLEVKDSEIFVGDKWTAEDNFVSATGKDGKDVAFGDIVVEGTVDTSKAGEYKVVYKNGDIEKIATIKVIEILSTLEVKDSEIFAGDKWTAEDNFVSATGKDGEDVAFGDIVVEGTVDTSKAGEYKVVYKNGDVEKTATIKVKESQATLVVKDSEILAADKWTAKDNFVSAKGKDGKDVAFGDIVVEGTVDTNKVGENKVVYKNDTITKTATVKVLTNPNAPIENDDGSIEFLDRPWDVINDYGNGIKMIAMQEGVLSSKFNATGYFNSNDDLADGYRSSLEKSVLDNWYVKNIAGTKYEQFVQPVSLSNPTFKIMKELGYDGVFTESDWNKEVNEPSKYPTIIGSGEKQVFLMSGSDLTKDEKGNFKAEAVTHINRLKRNGIAYTHLRSPSTGNSSVGGMGSLPKMYKVTVVTEVPVVPTVVVRIPSAS